MRAFDNSTPNLPNSAILRLPTQEARVWHSIRGQNHGPSAPHAHTELASTIETLFVLSELAVEDTPEH